jgi:hypothetical protein
VGTCRAILPSLAAGLVTVELRDQSGRLLPGLIVGNRWYVIGEEGQRYSIVVRNHSEMRLEAVISVDGLDVLDGRPRLSANVVTSSRRTSAWSWKVFGKALMRSRPFISARCAKRMPTKNIATRATWA